MSSMFLNEAVLADFSVRRFKKTDPFPWTSLDQVLSPDAFAVLLENFPPKTLFEWVEGKAGQHFVRSHDRWFLDYRPDLESRPGVAGPGDLPEVWRNFVHELETSAVYRDLIHRCLDRTDVHVRFNWHRGVTGSEVCPHVDKDAKIGTHIFYFNTAEDWDASWGGSTLVLDGKDPGATNPDFEDFASARPVENLGNKSFLFKNAPEAWHGVRRLTCPEGVERLLFNAVWEGPPVAAASSRPAGRLEASVRRRVAGLRGR